MTLYSPPRDRESMQTELSVMHYWWSFFLVFSCFHCGTATITLTSTVDGRQAACSGEVVTYTCTVIQAASIGWTAAPVLVDSTLAVFLDTDTSGESRSCSDTSQCADLDFQATLTNVSNSMINVADLTSTFRFTARAELNGATVQCRGVTAASTPPTASEVLNVVGLPSPPRALSYTVEQYGRDSVTLTVQWQSPQDGGGAPVNYTITVSPGSTQVTTTATNTSLRGIPYNVTNTVSIVATNCNGSSSAVMETIRIANCSDPATPGNGFFEPYQNTTEGAEIFFRCNSGFVPNRTVMATCEADGRWNPDPATHVCTFDCGPPPAPRNGSLESYTDTTEGSVVFYSCDSGLVPEGRMMSVCTRSGWSPNPGALSCSVVNCGMPIGPRNGFIEMYQSTLVGSEVFFMCAPGFVPAGRMRANCTSDRMMVNGTWTPDPATLMCNASTVDCGDPNNATSEVIVQYSSTRVSSVIFYQCRQSGFAPSSSSAVCMESGRWSPDPSQVVCTTTSPTGEMNTPDRSLSPTAVTAITAVVCSLVAFILGALCSAVIIVCISRWRCSSKPASNVQEQNQKQRVPVYEEVDTPSQKIELKENVAYGPRSSRPATNMPEHQQTVAVDTQSQKIELKENVAYGPVKVH